MGRSFFLKMLGIGALALVLMVPVAVSSLSSLVTPVIGVIGGMWLLGEQPGWSEFLGAGLILGALATVLLPQRK